MRSRPLRTAPLFCLLLSMVGCGRSVPEAADPQKAHESLQVFLAAWRNGETMESLRKRKPAITSSDSQWQNRYRLLRYEIARDDSGSAGFDRQCRVVLWLLDPDGKETKETATYTVSLQPAIVIVRVES